MPTIIVDGSGNPVIPTEPIADPNQQVADTQGNIINPSKEDGNLLSVKNNLDDVKTKLDSIISGNASEATLAQVRDSLDTVETKLQSLIDNTDTLEVNTDDLESKVQSVRDQLNVLSSTRASEATLALIKAKTDNIDVLLSTVATQATLALIKAKTDNLDAALSTRASESTLSSLNSKDFATQTTLALIKAKTDNLDIALSTRASETTLSGIKADLDNVISTANSTTTPLGIGRTFTGTAEDATKYGTISVFIFSNVASATDGFKIQYSIDGTNWDDDDTYTIPANNGKFFTFSPEARYFRIYYTNGSVAQTTFRLQVVLKARHTKPSSHRIDDIIEENSDAELVRAVISDLLVTLCGEDKAFFGSVELSLATAGSENKVILLRNPSGSGKNLFLGISILDMLTKGGQATIRMYKNPTITSVGTAVTPISSRLGGNGASVMTLYSAPTISANGTRVATYSVGKDASSLSLDFKFGLELTPGNDILITGSPDANNRTVAVTFQWVEV